MPENSVRSSQLRDIDAGVVATFAPIVVHDRKELASAPSYREKSLMIERAELALNFHKLRRAHRRAKARGYTKILRHICKHVLANGAKNAPFLNRAAYLPPRNSNR